MHVYTLSENQRSEIEMIMTTCYVSLQKMKQDFRNPSKDEVRRFERADNMYMTYMELFKNPEGGLSPLDKFTGKK